MYTSGHIGVSRVNQMAKRKKKSPARTRVKGKAGPRTAQAKKRPSRLPKKSKPAGKRKSSKAKQSLPPASKAKGKKADEAAKEVKLPVPKLKRPKILLVDCPPAATELLAGDGYNVQSGTFGRPYR